MASHSTTIRHSRVIAHTPVFYGWIVWAVAAIGLICSAPGQAFTVSIFLDHYIVEFGIGRTLASGLFGLGTFIAAFGLTWIGKCVDRYGNRVIGVIVAVSFSVVLVLVSLITGPLTMFLSFVAIRLLGQGSMTLVSLTAIAQWWRSRRGWVVGLALVCFALFQTFYLGLLQSLIEMFGWRTTWVFLGVAVGAVMVPLWWVFMRDRPENYGLLPDAMADHVPHTSGDNIRELQPEDNWTLSEAVRAPTFWVFVCGRMFAASWGTGLVFHQVSIFTGLGHSAAAVGYTYGLLALVNALITLIAGRLINRVRRPGYVMTFQLSMIIVSMLLAMTMREPWMLYVYALTFGVVFALGATFDGSVWADLFGRLHHGAIRGFVTTALVIGSSIGPVIYGFSFDYFGSYQPVLWLGIVLVTVPLIASTRVNRPEKRQDPDAGSLSQVM
jgi:MFS family permease